MAVRQTFLEMTAGFFDYFFSYLFWKSWSFTFTASNCSRDPWIADQDICSFKALPFTSFLCNSRELQTNNVTCKITFLPAQILQELTQLCCIHDVSIIIYIICKICSPVIPKFPYKFIQPWQHCSSSCQVLLSGGVSRCYKIPIHFFIFRSHLYKKKRFKYSF